MLRLRDYVRSYVWLLVSVAGTVFRGYRNAWRVQKNIAGSGTLVVIHQMNSRAGDLELFFARLAILVSKESLSQDLDLLLWRKDDDDVRSFAVYCTIARLFGHRVNFYVLNDALALSNFRKTVTIVPISGYFEKSNDAIMLPETAIGSLRLPLLPRNTAREYLKTIDAKARFCALSLPADTIAADAMRTFAQAVERHPAWHFVLLNDAVDFDGRPVDLPTKLLQPSRAGFDLLTRLCIVAEADAYFGATDIYGLCAYLAGRPAHLLPAQYLVVGAAASNVRLCGTDS